MNHPIYAVFSAHTYSKPHWLNGAVAFVEKEMDLDGGHDWGHLSRVLNQALCIARTVETRKVDLEILVAAVLFHDIVNLPKDSPNRKDASKLSAEKAIAFFASEFSKIRSEKLRNAIEAHSFSAGISITCIEAEIVQDADRLESVGALAIARTFYVSGLMGTDLFHPEDPFGETREKRNDRKYAVDHFFQKVFLLPDLMHSKYAKELAYSRNAFVEKFLDALRLELNL